MKAFSCAHKLHACISCSSVMIKGSRFDLYSVIQADGKRHWIRIPENQVYILLLLLQSFLVRQSYKKPVSWPLFRHLKNVLVSVMSLICLGTTLTGAQRAIPDSVLASVPWWCLGGHMWCVGTRVGCMQGNSLTIFWWGGSCTWQCSRLTPGSAV